LDFLLLGVVESLLHRSIVLVGASRPDLVEHIESIRWDALKHNTQKMNDEKAKQVY